MKTYLALTLDAEPAWFGYVKGTGHVIMSTVITPGGDHIGGNPVMQTVCSDKPLDATRQTNKVTAKFQGDAKCKRCEAWLKSLGAADAIESARDAAYTEANADMIAELKAERSPERLAQIAATERQWDDTLKAILTPEPVADDESAPSAPLSDVGLPKRPFPPEAGTLFHTGSLANEAAIVRGKSQSGAPADRRTVKVPGVGKVVASRGTMSDATGRDHLDESVKSPRETVIRVNGVDVGPRKMFATTHPSVAETCGVTVRKYESKSPAWQREYRRKLARKSAAAYAADVAAKAERKAEAAAKRAAAKIAKGGK